MKKMELRFKFKGTTIVATLSSSFTIWIVIDNWRHLSHTNDGDNNDYIDSNDDERQK